MHVFSLARQALFAAGLFTFAAPVAASSPEQQFGAVADLLSAGKADDAMQTLAQLNAQSPDFHLGRQFYDELKARLAAATQPPLAEIGSASCRERVCPYVYVSVVAVSLKKKHTKHNPKTRTNTT